MNVCQTGRRQQEQNQACQNRHDFQRPSFRFFRALSPDAPTGKHGNHRQQVGDKTHKPEKGISHPGAQDTPCVLHMVRSGRAERARVSRMVGKQASHQVDRHQYGQEKRALSQVVAQPGWGTDSLRGFFSRLRQRYRPYQVYLLSY